MGESVTERLSRLKQEATDLHQRGQYEKAIRPATEICKLARKQLGKSHPGYAASLFFVARLRKDMGDYTEAEALYRKALEIMRAAHGEKHPDFASCLDNLGALYHSMGNYAEAEPLYRQALEIKRAAFGEKHPELAGSLNNLGELYRVTGRHSAAEPLYRQALESVRAGLGERHPYFAISLNNLALLYFAMGDLAAAEPLCRQALEIERATLGEHHPNFATSMRNLADLCKAMGSYAEAEQLYRQTVAIVRAALGEKHPDFGGSLNDLAAMCRAMGSYAEAEKLFRQALEVRRAALGERHPDVAASLNSLGELYQAMGDYEAAEPLYRQALEIRRTALGEKHPAVAASLNNLAALSYLRGDYAAAEPLYRQALEIAKLRQGEKHPDFATSLNNLALLLEATGDYVAAEPLHRQALEIRRTALGEKHPDFAASVNNLASLHSSMGEYAAAEPLYRQALEIKRATLGEKHPDFATGLNNLAVFYAETGNYAAAEPLYRQALEIKRTALGESHPEVATGMDNLALLYESTGDYEAALRLHQQALQTVQAALGETSRDYAEGLGSLARLYEVIGDYSAAEPLHQRALEIKRARLGKDHPEVASSLNNLALLYQMMGDYRAAERLFRQALEIRRARLPEKHPDVAGSLHNLAGLHHSMGDYAAADPLYRQALEIKRAALGEDHPSFAANLTNLAGLYAATGQENEALKALERAGAIGDRMIGQIFSIGSESQRMAYLKVVEAEIAGFLSLISSHLSSSAAAVRAGLDLVLRRKAIAAEALATQRDAILRGRYPVLQPKLSELSSLRMRIAQKTLAGSGPEGLSAHLQLLAEWNEERARLEADLARQIPEMNLERELRKADRQAVASALPEGVALVEFVRFNVFDFKAVPARQEPQWKPARYVAFVLPAGEPDGAQMIDLGEAEFIDRLIAAFRMSITGEAERRGASEAPSAADAGSAQIADVGMELRAAVFDPLTPALGDRVRLLVATDGDLTRLPFEILPSDEGGCLIDGYQIGYLSTGRDVLRFGMAPAREPGQPLVVADPDFDLGVGVVASEARVAGVPGRRSRALERSQLHFDRLQGTRVEGERTADMLRVDAWLDKLTLERRLKNMRSPRILHIATHGFFLPDQRRDLRKGPLGQADASREGTAGSMPSEGGLENPLLRSGLALAGANTFCQNKVPPEEAEDGLLTAEDVTGLDLLDTELVVLSACETGLGEVHIGEGVFGLRRSFVVAGAKGLVMSLWKVPDRQTQELMEEFYRRILEGKPRADALREAQLAMKSKYPHPFYWGAFIYQGDPGPIPVTEAS